MGIFAVFATIFMPKQSKIALNRPKMTENHESGGFADIPNDGATIRLRAAAPRLKGWLGRGGGDGSFRGTCGLSRNLLTHIPRQSGNGSVL